MADRLRPLSWVPPSVAEYTYTVLLKPKPLRAVAQAVIKALIPPQIRVHGVDLVLNREDAVVSGALTLGCYERFELSLFEQMLWPGMSVVDVGANIGLYTAVAARGVGPAGAVLAIEPESRNCELIRQTVDLNGFRNVRVYQGALADRTGRGRLFLCTDNKADHRIYASRERRAAVAIDVATFDDVARTHAIARVDLVKIDVQGAEALVFAGMRDTLTANHDIRLLTEFWPWGIAQAGGDPSRLLRSFRDLGFSIYELVGDSRRIEAVTDDRRLAARGLERQHANLLLQRQPLDHPLLAGRRGR
jgi:FkbM family methyltransferase